MDHLNARGIIWRRVPSKFKYIVLVHKMLGTGALPGGEKLAEVKFGSFHGIVRSACCIKMKSKPYTQRSLGIVRIVPFALPGVQYILKLFRVWQSGIFLIGSLCGKPVSDEIHFVSILITLGSPLTCNRGVTTQAFCCALEPGFVGLVRKECQTVRRRSSRFSSCGNVFIFSRYTQLWSGGMDEKMKGCHPLKGMPKAGDQTGPIVNEYNWRTRLHPTEW